MYARVCLVFPLMNPLCMLQSIAAIQTHQVGTRTLVNRPRPTKSSRFEGEAGWPSVGTALTGLSSANSAPVWSLKSAEAAEAC